jgi:hypothetical protein
MSAPPDQTQELPAPGRRPRIGRTAWIVLAVVVAVVLAAALVVLGDRLSDGDDDDRPRAADRTASGPLEGREQASLVLLDGAATVRVQATDLGDRLYRVATPEGGEQVPVVTVDGDEVRLELADTDGTDGTGDTDGNGASAVDVELSSAVRWHVRILGGVTDLVVNLAQAQASGVELGGGAASVDLTLPPPEGTMPVRMTGGVGQWSVHQVGDAPVRVRVGGGAGSVTIDGVQEGGIAGGTVFAPPEWDGAADRVDIDAVAGMSVFDLDRR